MVRYLHYLMKMLHQKIYKKSSNKVESKHMFNNVNGNVCFDKTSIWSITVVLTRNATSLSGISITISIYIMRKIGQHTDFYL